MHPKNRLREIERENDLEGRATWACSKHPKNSLLTLESLEEYLCGLGRVDLVGDCVFFAAAGVDKHNGARRVKHAKHGVAACTWSADVTAGNLKLSEHH